MFHRSVRRRVRGHTKPQAPRKQRVLWDYFKKEVVTFRDGSTDRTKNSAKCNICSASLQTPDSTPEPLKKHLKAHHPLQYAEWLKKQEDAEKVTLEAKKAATEVEKTVFKTPSIESYMKRTPYPINGPKQERLDLELAMMVVMCNLPFQICDNPWFKRYSNALDPKFTVKSRTTIGNKKVRILFNNVMEAVKKHLDADLKDVTGMGLTTDTWQSRANESFQSLTIHYISKNFDLKR